MISVVYNPDGSANERAATMRDIRDKKSALDKLKTREDVLMNPSRAKPTIRARAGLALVFLHRLAGRLRSSTRARLGLRSTAKHWSDA